MSGKIDQSIIAELGVWFVDDTLKGLMVKAYNDTRWNPVYLMVRRALRLRDVIDVFCMLSLLDPKEEKRIPAEDVLSCENWAILAEIIEILQPYLKYTKHFEGCAPRYAEVLPTMYLMKNHLSEMRQRYSSNLIPAPYRAPRTTLEEPVLDCIIVAAPTGGRERESNREGCNRTPAYLPGADIRPWNRLPAEYRVLHYTKQKSRGNSKAMAQILLVADCEMRGARARKIDIECHYQW
jgi:hypothetical protein